MSILDIITYNILKFGEVQTLSIIQHSYGMYKLLVAKFSVATYLFVHSNLGTLFAVIPPVVFARIEQDEIIVLKEW